MNEMPVALRESTEHSVHRKPRRGQNISQILMPGETIEFVLRPHWRYILAGLIIGLGSLVFLAAWRILWYDILRVQGSLPLIIGILLTIFILLRWTVRPVVRWMFIRYYFTTSRIMVRSGIIAKAGAEVPLTQMANIYYTQSVLDRVLRCGQMSVDSSGGDGFEIQYVPHVEQVTRELNILIKQSGNHRNNNNDQHSSTPHPANSNDDEQWNSNAAETYPTATTTTSPSPHPTAPEDRILILRVQFGHRKVSEQFLHQLCHHLDITPRAVEPGTTTRNGYPVLLDGDAAIAGYAWRCGLFLTSPTAQPPQYEIVLSHRKGHVISRAEETEHATLQALMECGVSEKSLYKVTKKRRIYHFDPTSDTVHSL